MTTVWAYISRVISGFLLQENGDYLLLETGDKIILNQSQDWTDISKNSASWTNVSRSS